MDTYGVLSGRAVLTMRTIAVPLGDKAAAARAADYPLERSDSPQAYARGNYYAKPDAGPGDGSPRVNALWLGSDDALAQIGVSRGEAVTPGVLAAVLQGEHAVTGDRVRRPGMVLAVARDEAGHAIRDGRGEVVRRKVAGTASTDMTFSAPKSVSVAWSQASPELREQIEDAILHAAERTVEYMVATKGCVYRRIDGQRVREPAVGAAAACSLHVTARRAERDEVPMPQLHVHSVIVGVQRRDGRLVGANSFAWFKHDAALEGGAFGRLVLADELTRLGFELESGTGRDGRYFEIVGVPESLREAMSPRAHEVEARAREELLALGVRPQGKALGVIAEMTRQAKSKAVSPGRCAQVWSALGQEHGLHGHGAVEAVLTREPARPGVEERRAVVADAVLERIRERGPTVTAAAARATVYAAAAGRLSAEETLATIEELERDGVLVALAGDRVTTHEIRRLEQRVMQVAQTAARRDDAPLPADARARGLAVADDALGEGRSLDREQREAFERLTGGGGWVCLTGRAGTGKGPTLHAVAEAYRAAGWQVIACAMDGTTARRMAEQLGGRVGACTAEQLKRRLELGLLSVDARTVVIVDEASKIETSQWAELATLVHRDRARLVAVGHDGQMDAIELPGLFSEMLADPGIQTSTLTEIRRHRDPEDPSRTHPWLGDYQVALDEGRAHDAVAILRANDAIHMHERRADAIKAMVDEWDGWRRRYAPTQSLLIVHGSNADVDLVNECAQAKRIAAGELGDQEIKAVDRRYSLRRGDVVRFSAAPYVFPRPPDGGQRERRVENGQAGVVVDVDPARDRLEVRLHEPGVPARAVRIDMAALREAHRVAGAARVPSVRLAYAQHPFPAQGATIQATAALAGHWSQTKKPTYVADTRAVLRHSVHTSREDLGVQGDDTARMQRYAHRLASSPDRAASVHRSPDPSSRIGVRIPAANTLPGRDAPARVDAAARHQDRDNSGHDADSPKSGRPAADPALGARPPAGAVGNAEHTRERRPQELAHETDNERGAFDRLAPRAARELLGLQRAVSQATERERAFLERSRELEQRAATRGWRERRTRQELRHAAAIQRQLADDAQLERERANRAAGQLRRAGYAEGRSSDRRPVTHGPAAAREATACDEPIADTTHRTTDSLHACVGAANTPPPEAAEPSGCAQLVPRDLERNGLSREPYLKPDGAGRPGPLAETGGGDGGRDPASRPRPARGARGLSREQRQDDERQGQCVEAGVPDSGLGV